MGSCGVVGDRTVVLLRTRRCTGACSGCRARAGFVVARAGFAACAHARADSVARAAESPACARATTGVLETATGPGCHTCAPGRGRIVRASEGCSCVQRADCCVAACAGCSSAPGDCSGEMQHSVDSHEKRMRGC